MSLSVTHRIRRLVTALLALTAINAGIAFAAPHTDYTLDLSLRHAQIIGVKATFKDVEGDSLRVHLPVWRTGLYRLIDPVGTVSEVRVFDQRGDRLNVTQTAKSTWEIELPANAVDAVVFEYLVYARSLEDRTRDANAEHVFINPGLVMVYADSHRHFPIEVKTALPAGWRIASGMDSIAAGHLSAPSYDRLVDSPIEIGTFDTFSFEAAGATIEFVIHGDWDGDAERLERDVRAIAESAAAVFGDMPTERYVFLVHSAPGLGGGTEYYNSTVVHTRPERFWDGDGYQDFLSLLTHELFHLWNVKRFRPAGIARYDYLQENYTDLLWVAEGITSYYDNMLLARSGVISVEDYRDRVAENVDDVLNRPGYGRDSLAHASFEAWTKGYHQGTDRGPDKANRTVSFYTQGGLLGLVLDLEIRGRSAGEYTLDDVMRSLYHDFPLESAGYTYAEVRERVARFGSASLADQLDGWVLGTERLPVDEVLARVGWSVSRESSDETAQADLGIRGNHKDGGHRVSYVRLDGPAWQAGINVDDLLIAINDRQIGSTLDDLLERHRPEDEVVISLFRDGQLRRLPVTLGAAVQDHVVTPMDDAAPATQDLLQRWLNIHDAQKVLDD